jgi:dTDP-4-dehydrorhamnose reductase
MKYLIVGADGQLGQEWVVFLSKEKAEFSYFTFNDLDITDFEKLEQVIIDEAPKVIINCAAFTAVDKAESEFELAKLINYKAVKKLSELCFKYEIMLVHYSTDYVFAGNSSDRNQYPKGYPENAEPNPINKYGISKWKGENSIINSGCKYLILRLSWLCGAYGNNFITTMLRLAEEKDTINVVNDQFGIPIYTEQVVTDSIELIKNEAEGIYHLGSEGIITWFEFAKKIFEISNIEIDVQPVNSSEFPTKAIRPNYSKLSTQKIEKELNTSSRPWEEGLRSLLMQLKNENH